jgi:hypothetical protein
MLRFIGSVLGVSFFVVACGGGGSGTVGGATGGGGTGAGGTGGGVSTSAPTDLFYHIGNYQGAIAVRMNVGVPYVLDRPTVIGTVTSYAVSPALPAGVSLNPSTGLISGTPQSASPETAYTVTASNDDGSTTTTIYVTVYVPPSGLTYASPINGMVGTALTDLAPALSGDADNFSVQPALPAGLSLNPTTGVVSGTPTVARVPATYTITASNLGGASITFDLLLAVDPPSAGTVATGVFRDSAVNGLGYVSGSNGGVTDQSGAFTYETGLGITFFVGQVNIGTVPTAKALITPVDLVAGGTGTSNHVLNVVRFLMMLDQDNNPSNGIQISTAVSAAATSWGPVDFDTADLPTALAPLVQSASTADGVTHALPDAASAQARLRTDFFCTYSGIYVGTYSANSAPGDHGTFAAQVYPDGSMHASAYGIGALAGFDVVAANALNPLLDATFAMSSQSPNIALQGSFSDSTYLRGSYLADSAGTFEAVGNTDNTSAYKFVGTYTSTPSDPTSPFDVNSGLAVLGMDDSNQVSGTIDGGSLHGTVTGTAFVGTWFRYTYPFGRERRQVSGTFAKTDSGYTLDGQFGRNPTGTVTEFSTVGCRAN